MSDNYEHYISKNIKSSYKNKLPAPAIYLTILVFCWHIFSLRELLFPAAFTKSDTIESLYKNETRYVNADLTDLHFTGYTRTFFGNTTGYYYYTLQNNECFFVLLSPKSCEEGLPIISEISISAELISNSTPFSTLLDNIAKDLNWTAGGIRTRVSPHYLSEPDFNAPGNQLLFLFLFITGGYALISIIMSLIFIGAPDLSPPCQDLGLYGNAKELLNAVLEVKTSGKNAYSAKCREWVEKQFHRDGNYQKYLSLYQSLAAERKE